MATTVRVGGGELRSVVVAASPVLTTTVVAAAAASTPTAVRATRRHCGTGRRRLLSYTLCLRDARPGASSSRLLTHRAGADAARQPVAMLLPQLERIFADRERLAATGKPRVH